MSVPSERQSASTDPASSGARADSSDPTLAHAFITMIHEDHASGDTDVNPSAATACTAAA